MIDQRGESPTHQEVEGLPDAVIKIMVANQERIRRLFRRWLIIATMVLAGGVGYNSWQAHEANVTVSQIRRTQVANTGATHCLTKAVNDAVADVALGLIAHDMNPTDYQALKSC